MGNKDDKLREEIERLALMSVYERETEAKGYMFIGGMDEAGRGPFVGPVVAACVILNKDAFIPGLNDSKKLSESKREKMYDEIIKQSVSYGVGLVDNETIDRINILNATKLAMKKAIENMSVKPDYLLIDYVKLEDVSIPQLSLTKGDSLSVSIAAASVIAKVTRDRLIRKVASLYPEYGFESNKGYGTPQHLEALLKYGPCPLHRRTFIKNYIA